MATTLSSPIWGAALPRPRLRLSGGAATQFSPPSAQGFNLWEALGGRGLSEKGVESTLKEGSPSKPVAKPLILVTDDEKGDSAPATAGGFDKEMGGLTGGFPGGEVGVKKFVRELPVPMSREMSKLREEIEAPEAAKRKAEAPPPPLLMPGMTVICKNPKHPYYMFTGIVQRVTDGRAGVLFEGGCWDHLEVIRLVDLQRAPPPPMTNPQSAILLLQQQQQQETSESELP